MTLAVLGVSPPATSDEPTAADLMFMAARRARSESGYARYSVYATVVRFHRGARPFESTWDTVEDMTRRLVHAHSLAREEARRPHVPRGINVAYGIGRGGPGGAIPIGPIINPEPSDDVIGQLSFAIDQDFGLALYAPPIGATTDMSQIAAAAPLPRIGRTGIVTRTYEVTDVGDVTEDGAALHHLALRPLRDPKRNRLRELWTDAKTSLPVHAIVAGIGNRSPLQDVSWRVDFTQYQGGTYLAREAALAPLQFRQVRIDEVTISFADLRPTNRLTGIESLGLSADVGTTDP